MIREVCLIKPDRNSLPLPAEVVGFRDNRVLLMPLGPMDGIKPGSEVQATRTMHKIRWATACWGAYWTAWATRSTASDNRPFLRVTQ